MWVTIGWSTSQARWYGTSSVRLAVSGESVGKPWHTSTCASWHVCKSWCVCKSYSVCHPIPASQEPGNLKTLLLIEYWLKNLDINIYTVYQRPSKELWIHIYELVNFEFFQKILAQIQKISGSIKMSPAIVGRISPIRGWSSWVWKVARKSTRVLIPICVNKWAWTCTLDMWLLASPPPLVCLVQYVSMYEHVCTKVQTWAFTLDMWLWLLPARPPPFGYACVMCRHRWVLCNTWACMQLTLDTLLWLLLSRPPSPPHPPFGCVHVIYRHNWGLFKMWALCAHFYKCMDMGIHLGCTIETTPVKCVAIIYRWDRIILICQWVK